jgi:hypothetical protein
MPFPYKQLCLIICALLIFPPSPLLALDIDQLSWDETREEWGQVMFCQRIYKLPGVTSRLYDFDVEHCDKAGQLMLNAAAKYSQQDQVQLKNQAERHAFSLSRNTTEPYHSVPACRSYCRELADKLDKQNER